MGWWSRIAKKLWIVEEEEEDQAEKVIPMELKPVPPFNRAEVAPVTVKRTDIKKVMPVPVKKTEGESRGLFGLGKKKEVSMGEALAEVMQLVIKEPVNFDDCDEIARLLKEGQPVLINFEKTDPVIAKRVSDYISGVVYGLKGNLKQLTPSVILCSNKQVKLVTCEHEGEGTAE